MAIRKTLGIETEYGIVLRGASFAFRKYSETLGQARLFGAVFALSSIMAPFFFGAVAGLFAYIGGLTAVLRELLREARLARSVLARDWSSVV